jgi:hypothetical protein
MVGAAVKLCPPGGACVCARISAFDSQMHVHTTIDTVRALTLSSFPASCLPLPVTSRR